MLGKLICRQYHHHIVDIIQRLIQGIKQKGAAPVIDVADIAQVTTLQIHVDTHSNFACDLSITHMMQWHQICTNALLQTISSVVL